MSFPQHLRLRRVPHTGTRCGTSSRSGHRESRFASALARRRPHFAHRDCRRRREPMTYAVADRALAPLSRTERTRRNLHSATRRHSAPRRSGLVQLAFLGRPHDGRPRPTRPSCRSSEKRSEWGTGHVSMESHEPVVVKADLDRSDHQEAVVAMTAAYALDEMGNGGPLPQDVLDRLVPGLRSHPTTLVLLAYVDGVPVGIATCFLGFSTFAARPLVNVHDLSVLPEHRGRGVAQALLRAVERAARERGCVKLTLEVQENNGRARRLYERAGLAQAVCGDNAGGSLFYSKNLGEGGAAQQGVAADSASRRR